MVRAIAITALRKDGGTQPRAYTDNRTVDEYAEAMGRGVEFPPIIVFHDGKENWLADGFHRMLAAHHLGRATILAEVREGTAREAILFAVGANATHGRPRTHADKRHAVMKLLKDPEWVLWSDNEIARRCAVHQTFVLKVRKETQPLSYDNHKIATRLARRAGTTYAMNTSNMKGKGRAKAARPMRDEAASSEAPSAVASTAAAERKAVGRRAPSDGKHPSGPKRQKARRSGRCDTIDTGNVVVRKSSKRRARSKTKDTAPAQLEMASTAPKAEHTKPATSTTDSSSGPTKHDSHRINTILASMKEARSAWNDLVVAWGDPPRIDMLWAVKSSPELISILDEAIEKIAAIAAGCEMEGAAT